MIEDILTAWRNKETVDSKPLKTLYNTAKEAYYKGTPIMEDFEFDELESQLGLENKSHIGTKHNPSYTIEHPFVMGSLSKIQIHKNKEGNIDWDEYFCKLAKYFNPLTPLVITPKFDGCSFEVVTGSGIESISSRGDGTFGKDLYKHLIRVVNNALGSTQTWLPENNKIIYRGEVLIKKDIFEKKYSEFVNPRSFVAGILNREFDDKDPEFTEMLRDLDVVIYDVRKYDGNTWSDIDWFETDLNINNTPKFYIKNDLCRTAKEFETCYHSFENYRNECPYALDGIVFKPNQTNRLVNLTEHRPKDCVAIKFIPMLEETEVVKIEWNIKKFGNMIPTIWVKPVYMDGKKIQKCSGSNYSNLINKKVSVGSKVIMSLAGDIIPFLYKVTDTTAFDINKLDIPTNVESYIDGVNLKAVLSEEDKKRMMFVNSCKALNIPGIGPAIADRLFSSYLNKSQIKEETADFFGLDEVDDYDPFENYIPENILMVEPNDIEFIIGGALGKKCKKAYKEVLANITLVDIIKSCNFRLCGERMSEEVAKYLTGAAYSWDHMASEGYTWCLDENNCGEEGSTENMNTILNILAKMGKSFNDFSMTSVETNNEDKIAVILTGDPNNYATKAEFMKCHPEYREVKTTKAGWNECKILFTNSLSSKTKKMQEAEKRGIEIKIY